MILQSEGPRPMIVSRSRAGFTLNIIDTPGIVEGGYVNDQALELIKRFVSSMHVLKVINFQLFDDICDIHFDCTLGPCLFNWTNCQGDIMPSAMQFHQYLSYGTCNLCFQRRFWGSPWGSEAMLKRLRRENLGGEPQRHA